MSILHNIYIYICTYIVLDASLFGILVPGSELEVLGGSTAALLALALGIQIHVCIFSHV